MELFGKFVYHWRVGAKTLTHASLTLLAWYMDYEHRLLVGHDVIRGISNAIIQIHVGEMEFLGHLDQGNGVYEGRVCIAIWYTFSSRVGTLGIR